ncbi:glycoside hydrolase family 105 protein [Bacteroidota bacterium]
MKSFILLIYILFFISCTSSVKNNSFWQEKSSPEFIGQKITEDIFTRDEFMMYLWDNVNAVHYAEVCAAYGAAKLAGFLKDTLTLEKLTERYMRVINDSITNTANHVDATVYGILPLELYMQTNNEIFYEQGIELADLQWENPLPNGLTNQTRYWIDDIYMIGSLQVQAYRATGKEIYLERAALEINSYLLKLQQENGLFHHGENAPFFWGRGNGWVAAGLAELLSELPESNKNYNAILNGYKKMMDALLNSQADDGMWRQIIDNEEAWKETSSTAMFGYAILIGVKKGILNKEKFTPSYQKAWLALVDYVNEEGKISNVCVGTGQSTDINYYLNRPATTGDFHGQAPMLWFAYSLLSE